MLHCEKKSEPSDAGASSLPREDAPTRVAKPTIVDSVGTKLLQAIADDQLELLGASGAAYGRTETAALGLFGADWCCRLDPVGGTTELEGAEARSGAHWSCGEARWTSSARCMETGEPLDVATRGDLRLYAVPIVARGEAVAAMSFGYRPPSAAPNLEPASAGAASSHVPPFPIEFAKRRLRTSASLLGEVVACKRAEERLAARAASLEAERVRAVRHSLDAEVARGRAEKAERELARRAQELAFVNAELERSNEELERFATVASHDLRAPLGSIIKLSQWIEQDLKDALPSETRQRLEDLRGRVRRLDKLLIDLMNYSRAHRFESKSKLVDVGALLQRVVDVLDPPQRFTVSIAAGMPSLETSAAPLEQVFRNLIGNAIKHHDRPDGRVEVAVADRGDFYEFSVADDGPGIAPRHRERVFDMFQVLKSRDEVEGSGMGLAIVRKTIAAQGGEIRLESNDSGRGVTFRFQWRKHWWGEVQRDAKTRGTVA